MRLRPAPVLLVGLLAAAGCGGRSADLTARATDQWTRSYPLAEHGEVQVTTPIGRVEFEAVDGATVEVSAERAATAATETVARELLPRIVIKEDITPARVVIETQRISGIVIGVKYLVNYHVRVPRWALVRARTANGDVAVEGVTGRVVANTTNGLINARDLGGGVEARAINGNVTIDVRAVGSDPIDIRTTNGNVTLTIPKDAKAYVTAGAVNGTMDLSALSLEAMGEQSKRRARGRMNGGGTPVDLQTVNGRITVSVR